MNQFSHDRGHSLPIDGAELYVEQIGAGSGPVLLSLHGGLGSLMDLNPLLRHLSGAYRIVGVDFRGHGRSTLGREALSYARYERDMLAVLAALEIRSFDVLGFSDGGIVAYRLACAAPERVGRVVAIGAQWRTPSGALRDRLAGMTAKVWRERFPESVAYYQGVNPEPDFDRLVAAAVRLWTDAGPDGHPDALAGRIRAPMLIVRGHRDPLFPLADAQALCELSERTELLNLPFAGHEVHREQGQSIAGYIDEFLARRD